MSKLVYKSEDGSPIIIDETIEYNFEWTETPPPEGIYSPFYFNGVEWIGSSKEEFEQNNPVEPIPPNEIESLKQRIEELENIVKELTQGTD